jgi:hypothetical protein
MPIKKGAIKIIKRDEREKEVTGEVETKAATPRETARDMVATVSNWVTEFQQKRRAETSQAIKTLLRERAPSRA